MGQEFLKFVDDAKPVVITPEQVKDIPWNKFDAMEKRIAERIDLFNEKNEERIREVREEAKHDLEKHQIDMDKNNSYSDYLRTVKSKQKLLNNGSREMHDQMYDEFKELDVFDLFKKFRNYGVPMENVWSLKEEKMKKKMNLDPEEIKRYFS